MNRNTDAKDFSGDGEKCRLDLFPSKQALFMDRTDGEGNKDGDANAGKKQLFIYYGYETILNIYKKWFEHCRGR